MEYGLVGGEAQARVDPQAMILQNGLLAVRWETGLKDHGKIVACELVERSSGTKIRLSRDLFILKFRDGHILRSSGMMVEGKPKVQNLSADPKALKISSRVPGQSVAMSFSDSNRKLAVAWKAILRKDSNYLRQEIAISSADDQSISEVELFSFKAAGAHVEGRVKGSPVLFENAFFGFEHPLSSCRVTGAEVVCSMHRDLPLRAGQTVTYSSVMGVSSAGQMRRAFLHYIESERPRPYSPFLTYNSWYDIGYNNPYDEGAALDVIRALGEELVEKRKVKLDSFLFDDGWDDPHTLWSFGAGFPNGFTPLKDAAAKFGAAPGVWLSPWGGYEQAKEERLKYGREQGLETNPGGFALSGPKYFARFREVTLKFIRDYGVNQFKIDGTGNVNSVLPGSDFDSDFQAAISLIDDWRAARPDIFINLTTGTYPSPFWLRYADSIWRGGDDHSFAGVGTWRERWITYRDAATYRGVVQAGPLFPLNSLMLHGIIYAKQANHLGSDSGNDFANEAHSYFGSGTQLQELYITHSLLSKANWDTLAQSARWALDNANVLVDTHWVGGDPAKLQVYGWAAWSPKKAILTLRNPSGKRQIYAVDIETVLELPAGAARKYRAEDPFALRRGSKPFHFAAGNAKTITLQPFQVINLEATPEE